MPVSLTKRRFKEPYLSARTLSLLVLVKVLIQIYLYRAGFISVAADEFARGLRAATWAAKLDLDIVTDVQYVWLPLEKYLNGILLLVWNEPIIVPRITVFIASCITLVAFYLLLYHLFDSYAVAALSSIFMIFQPWYAWLSGTPMLEMYYFAFFFSGLLFLVLWIRRGRHGYWLFAGISFLLATGFHVQSWTLINLVNLVTLPYLYRLVRRGDYRLAARLLAFYLMGNSLIVTLALIEFATTGKVFAFLATHTSYSRWYYQGYEVPVFQKMLYYPRLIVQHVSGALWAGLLLSFIFLRRAQNRLWKLFPLLLVILALSLSSFLNVFSGPPSAAPPRYSVFHVMLLSSYLAYTTVSIFQWARQQPSQRWLSYTVPTLSTLLFVYATAWGAKRIPNFYPSMPLDSVHTGYQLNTLLDEDPGPYLVERHYWDFLAVHLTAGHYDDILFDREDDIRNAEISSLFSEEVSVVCNMLTSQNVRYVALMDESFKAKLEQAGFLQPRQQIGRWTIYEFVGC